MTASSMPTSANGVAAGDTRILSTPYARRLARERAVPLSAIAGTGPGGRITGADILGFTPPAAAAERKASPAPTAAVERAAAPAPAVSAVAASVDLSACRDLVVQFGDIAPAIGMIDIILKAATTGLRTAPGLATETGGTVLGLARDGTVQALAGLERLTLGAIATLRGDTAAPADGIPSLTVSLIERDGIRPVASAIEPGTAARLVVAAGPASTQAECLLSYDPHRLDDSAAADLLLAFKGALEFPLRLIA